MKNKTMKRTVITKYLPTLRNLAALAGSLRLLKNGRLAFFILHSSFFISIRSSFFVRLAAAFFILHSSFLITSCGLIYDDDCACDADTTAVAAETDAHISVSFLYDMNMEWADAFDHYVQDITLAVFDSDGLCVYTRTQPAAELDDRTMDISDITRGQGYTFICWATGEVVTAGCYLLPDPTVGVTTLDEMDVALSALSSLSSSDDLTLLFHDMEEDCDLTDLDEDNCWTLEMDLTRNTNVVRIVLQNLSGEDLSEDDFTMTVTDNNGHLAYDNSRTDEDITLTYMPWSIYSGTAGVDTDDDSGDSGDSSAARASTRTTTQVTAVIAEFTVNRLFADSEARLTVCNADDGSTVLSIPLVDYALLIKGNYNSSLSDQEYLDRQSEYNFTFFIDDSGNWYGAYIYINSWRVVLIDTDL